MAAESDLRIALGGALEQSIPDHQLPSVGEPLLICAIVVGSRRQAPSMLTVPVTPLPLGADATRAASRSLTVDLPGGRAREQRQRTEGHLAPTDWRSENSLGLQRDHISRRRS
jgi:hypothetical protein